MNKVIIGADIGGTTIKLGFINMEGDILHKWQIPTKTANNGASIITDIWESVLTNLSEQNLRKEAVLGIGIGAPGFINSETGLVYEAINIGWKNVDLAKELQNMSGLPVFVQNDANIAALGENWIGAGNHSFNMIAVTLGTGVGGGVIVNGSILNGENGMAGEIGHIKVDPNGIPCNCGGIGCLETICSATGIARQGMDAVTLNTRSNLASYYNKTGNISAKDILELAKSGDETCLHIVQHTTNILGMALANMASLNNPSKIIIGGGVSKAGTFLLDYITDSFKRHAIPKISETCEIKLAQLGNDAGMIGGAYLVKKNVG
ncbi:ROK family glucokinase [Oceanobacillus senegalensis]|uniref:ROK family glucokinase n=1 Tax=Oceanobacillus senegalensis TaxID=1936063 RepID=UPI000A307251|nr:ROK family glucokinase [Oceanobacillus senegalensis]